MTGQTPGSVGSNNTMANPATSTSSSIKLHGILSIYLLSMYNEAVDPHIFYLSAPESGDLSNRQN